MTAHAVISILISLTAFSAYLNYRYLKLPSPIGLTVITLGFSILIAISARFGGEVAGFSEHFLQSLNFNETFLHGMLGFLLFANALHVNTFELAKHKGTVALLATFGVVLSTVLIGFSTFGLAKWVDPKISVGSCLLFGALISPTDPITTLSLLKRVRLHKATEMKIAGEALFNDGMAIVLFVFLSSSKHWHVQEMFFFFLREGIGGLALGLALGWCTEYLLRTIDDSGVAILVTLALVTGGYTFAEFVAKVSGAICIASAGLVVGASQRTGRMSKKTVIELNDFWRLLDEVMNAILFVIIGLEFLSLQFTATLLWLALGVIGITILARWFSVAVPVGSLSLFRKFSPKIVFLMTWGGLRGGISVALALSLPAGPTRDFIVFVTYSVVLFSILVQGLTLESVVKKLFKPTMASNRGELLTAVVLLDASSSLEEMTEMAPCRTGSE